MSPTAEVLLAVIAVAVVVMALVQVVAGVILFRLHRRVETLSSRVEAELAPLAERLKGVADNLQRASSLAAVQVERVDRMFASVSRRAEETLGVVHHAIVAPLRELVAVIAAIRGVTAAVRGMRSGDGAKAHARFDDEDPLFIG